MKIEKESYSSSIGLQVVAANFATKYRHDAFSNKGIRQKVKEVFQQVGEEYGARYGITIHITGVDLNHIHTVIQFGPSWSIASVMRLIKGRTAHELFKKFPEWRKKYFWGGHLWSPAYHFTSTGNATFNHHYDYANHQGPPTGWLPKSQKTLDAFNH